uniref:Uncharacterized protein n=1 Tax=Setaria italica TaxID=4555 RepID=K3YB69_SETIT
MVMGTLTGSSALLQRNASVSMPPLDATRLKAIKAAMAQRELSLSDMGGGQIEPVGGAKEGITGLGGGGSPSPSIFAGDLAGGGQGDQRRR